MKICSVEGCDGKHVGNGYCSRHYQQIRLHGKISKRTMFDPNEFIFEGNICKILLYNQKCEVIAINIIDKEDYEKVKNGKMSITKDGYCWSTKVGLLHRFIMDCPEGMDVDHENHNTLDNRKVNLKICTRTQNSRNMSIPKNNTSGYKGVTWDKRCNKWMAQIMINRKNIFLGYFDDKVEAARAYNDAAIKHFGEFALLNNV